MRILVVNHCHPETPHVCATRAREFAAALARRGHRVVLLTQTLSPDDESEAPGSVRTRLQVHDWAAPFRLGCRPEGHRLLVCLRAGRLPKAAGKLAVGLYYGLWGSMFPDWGAGTRRYMDLLAECFSPDVIWANFGNTEGLRIARTLSRRCGCPWVIDVKDYWSAFIPRPFRSLLARRFADAAAMTALSRGHAYDIGPWMPREATVVYSGIPPALLAAPPVPVDRRRVLIVGAIYDRAQLQALVDGVGAWGDGTESGAILEYAGSEGALVAAAAARCAGISEFVDHGYLPLEALHRAEAGAFANAFVRSGPGWFQHKIAELLAAGRPVISLPASDAETADFAARADVPLLNCETAADVAGALSRIGDGDIRPDRAFLESLSWDSQAETLEKALKEARASATG